MSRPIEKIFLAGVFAVFVGATAYGVDLVREMPESSAASSTCESMTLQPGERLMPGHVTISVYNAGNVAGLAGSVQKTMARRGFQVDKVGNSASKVRPDRIAILVDEKSDPRARLLASQFAGKVEFAPSDLDVEPHVIPVILGSDFAGPAKKARKAIKLKNETTICVPPIEETG